MERKTFKFDIDVKSIDEEEGTFTGYAATFSSTPDSYGDVIDPGAFKKTIKERGDRIKILFNHLINEPIGKPIELSEDKVGLLVKGKLTLGVQRAKEVLALMKDGVINEMSIGYDTITETIVKGVRHLKEVKLYDTSPVVFAANPEAMITGVKKATSFGNLPLADRDRAWDAGAAIKRIKTWAGGDDIDWVKYRKAFFWYDSEELELQGSYKLAFADVINDSLKAIPRGVFAAAGVISGARGGVDIPSADEAGVKSHIDRYYAKMRQEFEDDTIVAPWKKSQMSVEEIKSTLEHVQALLKEIEGIEEPAEATPEPEVSEEAAKLNGTLDTLIAATEGFDERKAEAALDAALSQIK